ncbi:MAG: PKD domain-containing protein [Isosphaeraceae bacterium]
MTVDASHPDYLTLPGSVNQPQSAQEYTFTALTGDAISPTDRTIQGNFALTTQGATPTTNGLVMWYHALTSASPNNDAPFQLTEVSFRGNFYDPTVNVGTGFQYLLGPDVFPGAKTNSVDYDISFVDTINLPVAMEASDVPIPNTNLNAPFGWVGSSQTLDNFQNAITAFTSTNLAGQNTNFLGTYFDGRGYPSYVPVDSASRKLPSGQNLFLASPAIGAPSDIHYYKEFSDKSIIQEPLFALTSGGDGPSTLAVGGASANPSQGPFLGLNTSTMANLYILNQLIAPNVAKGHTYRVTYQGNTPAGNVIGMYYAPDGKTIIGVKLDQNVPSDPANQVYNFALEQTDYATSRIAGLWYSWANYYAENVKSTPQNNVQGTIANGSNILTLASPTSGLVPGMGVSGAGVPAGSLVLSVSSDQKIIRLSTRVSGSPTSFGFAAPSFSAIAGFDKNPKGNTPPVALSFPADEQTYALAFARTIFEVMSAWSVTVTPGAQDGWNPLLANIIGGNLGTNYLPDANTDVVNALTVLSKSALRGVPDYTNPLYSDAAQWYPDPAFPKGGQSSNVYNLDPFVWFVHKKLGLTAYAFSLDDDIGNVNAGGATHLDANVGGLGGLTNTDPYTNVSPWGVVTSVAKTLEANSSLLVNLASPQVVYQFAQFDYAHDTPGTLINGPGVPRGSTVQFTQISNDLSKSQMVLSNPLSGGAGSARYAFFGTLNFTGNVLGAGQADDTIILNDPTAYKTLIKLGPLQNLRVTGEGIDPSKTVTIKGLSQDASGIATLQLSANLDSALVSQAGGFYAYTIGSPVVGVVRDPGFEWANVQGLANDFNHGLQVSQNTVDWTFTDSTTQPKDWFAGIAFNNNSLYTKGNPAAPQGLQVAFVQGDSRIKQTITVGGGTYTLSGLAAQSAAFPMPQTLNVQVDGTTVGTIAPQGTTYQPFAIPITLTAGAHTITIVGTQANSGTTLLDAIDLNPTSTPPLGQTPLVLDVIPNQTVNEGETLSFKATATSSTGTPTFSLDPGASAGALIDPKTGVFTWRSTVPGHYSVTIRVTDANSPPLTASQTVVISVINVAPVVTLNPNVAPIQTADFQVSGSFNDVSSGAFNATVDYGDGSGPQPLTLGASESFVVAHTYTQPGTYPVIVNVRDAFGAVGTATLTLQATSAPLVSGFGKGRDAFVTSAYLETLGRLPDPASLRFWSRFLARGAAPRIVARSIWRSPEHHDRLRSGQVAPIPLRRSLLSALRHARQAVRLHLPPPGGPLTVRVAGTPTNQANPDASLSLIAAQAPPAGQEPTPTARIHTLRSWLPRKS